MDMKYILLIMGLVLLVGTASAELPVTDGLVAAYDFRQGADPATSTTSLATSYSNWLPDGFWVM